MTSDTNDEMNRIYSYRNGECKIYHKITGERLYEAEIQNNIDSQKIDEDIEFINNRFPDAKFTICLKPDELNDKISDEKQIVIKQTFSCYCHDTTANYDRPQPKFFVITNDNMTIENILDELIRQNMTADCNHQFFEGFYQATDAQYEMRFGS
tara:strand:+ start:4180 stop:4638 length:459 start_codon:yes stop_codon:yes gene_type:complete